MHGSFPVSRGWTERWQPMAALVRRLAAGLAGVGAARQGRLLLGALVALLGAASAAPAQEIGRWGPDDCARFEANSLEAAVLRCPGTASQASDGWAAVAAGESPDPLAVPPEGDELARDAAKPASSAIEISSKDW